MLPSMKRLPASTRVCASVSSGSLEVPSSFYSRSDNGEALLAGACGESRGGGAIYATALRRQPRQHSRSPTHRTVERHPG